MYSDEYVNEEDQEETSYNNSSDAGNKTKLIICGVLGIIIIILLFVALKGNGGSKNKNYVVKIIPEENIVIPVGGSYNLSATVTSEKGEVINGAAIRWSVDNEDIASVDNGIVKGNSYGKAMITAMYVNDEGKTFQIGKDVTVADGEANVSLTDVTIPDGELYLPLNDTYQINVAMTPPNGYVENKTFTSSNPSVATVDNKGLVTSIGEGEATITISVNNGAFTKELKVAVKSDVKEPNITVYPTKVVINSTVTKVKVGKTENLKYSIEPTNARSDKLTWTSSDPSILKVDNNGNITGVKEGEATITLSSVNDVSSKITITVEIDAVPVTDIELSVTDVSLSIGETQEISPVIIPDNATDPKLTFKSSDENVVKVAPSEDGTSCTITGAGSGSATITISANENVSVEVSVYVYDSTPIDPGSSGGGGGGSSCKKTCPNGQYVSNCKCVTCEAGNYCRDGKKTACSSGYTSGAGASSCTRSSCSAGTYLDSSYSTGCRPCPGGKVCSGGTSMPKSCSNGEKPNSGKTACEKCNIPNCKTHGGGGTSCTCSVCQTNYVTQGSSCKYVGTTTSKPCASRGTVGECTASSSCKWDYTYGCRNK